MLFQLYRGLTTLCGPLIEWHLARRRAKGKEDRTRFPERQGIATRARPDGTLLWLHAASVGESLSMQVVIERLLAERPGLFILVTTGTVTSADLMTERLGGRAFHQYQAVDRPLWVRRFLNHWRPDLVLWTESEFWPNSIAEIGERGIPLILLNGRISDGSFRQWQRFPGLIGRMLGAFTLCLGQTEADRDRLARLGASHAECLGNLKLAAPPLPAPADELERLSAATAGRPVWVAASTHNGEEAMAARIHRRLAASLPGLLTIIVPRHSKRGPDLATELASPGVTLARRGAGAALDRETGLYLADTMGELGLFYRLADVVFMGKSLVPLGGQNPLEAARLDCAVLFGPHMGNFSEIAARMLAVEAAREVADEAALEEALHDLLTEPSRRARLSEAARTFASAEASDIIDRLMTRLAPFLDAAEEAARARS